MKSAPKVTERPVERSRDWEGRSIASDEALRLEARARWSQLSAPRQMDLARCLARCRQAEFARGFKQVVSVTAGLRRREDSAGVEFLHNEPCLVFVVKRKLTEEQVQRTPVQRLPSEILTPALIDGSEQVVAVPTDVQRQRRMLSARSQALTGIQAQDSDGRWARGALTWILAIGNTRYGLAPVHVLSPLPNLDGVGRRPGAQEKLQGPGNSTAGNVLAQSTGFGGRVVPGGSLSFDAQLAAINQSASYGFLYGAMELSSTLPWVQSEQMLDQLVAGGQSLEIFAPTDNRNRPKDGVLPLQAARSLVEHPMPLAYDFGDGTRRGITHSVIELQIRFGDRTYPGDSGAPVVLRDANDRFTFVGMHVAGDGARHVSYVVPAWRLLSPASYTGVGGNVPPGAMRLVRRP
jgi:hypothetical protein